MIWNWIKNLFKPKVQKDPHEEMFEKDEYSYRTASAND